MKKSSLVLGIIFALVLLVAGGIYLNQKSEEQYMIDVVNSEEAATLFENRLQYFDQHALTESGLIKSYYIEYDKLEKNPMGGMIVYLIINNDSRYKMTLFLDFNNETGKLKSTGGSRSPELVKLLGEVDKDE